VPRWKITLEYDGSGFSGWQRQENAPSVQQTVEEAITSFCGEETRLQGAGRTDAGVHALAQVAHFDIQKAADAETIRDALNFYLREKPVCILEAESVGEDFQARFSAKARHYLYRVVNRKPPLVLDRNLVHHVTRELNLEAMQQAGAVLIGAHDFSTFRAQNCQAKSPNKSLDVARIEQVGDEFRFFFSARSFLYHQVRNMVGTILLVGTGQWSLEEFKTAFEARDRTKGGPTAPAHGLYFVRVDY
jgi:tRNA pseudouridine38-40 synthase